MASTTPASRPVRTTLWTGLATTAVIWFSRNVHHLTVEEKGLAITVVAGLLSAVALMVEKQVGKGFLRDVPSRTKKRQELTVRIHPDDLARLEAASVARTAKKTPGR